MPGRLFLSGSVSGRPQTWPLDRPRIGIGRSVGNVVQLQDDTVSREHAEILAEGELWLLRDLGGKNPTRVNGAPVKDPVPLRLGDRITFGGVVLVVTDGETEPPARLSDSSTLTTSLEIPAAGVLARGLQELPGTGPPCGVSGRSFGTTGKAFPDIAYRSGTVQLAPESLLAVFSDGIPERSSSS